MSEELKPCPFCGAPVTVSIKGKLGVIMCPVGTGCVGSGLGNFFNADQQETACAAWNRRAPDARLAAAEAEWDAAVARADKWEAKWDLLKRDYNDAGLKYGECRADILAEGERRATAAIVDWLRSRGDCQSADDEIAAWLQLQTGNPQ